jgi:hypothetical protein
MTTVYLAGPMQGYKNFNYDAFDEAERIVNEMANVYGLELEVINPANNFDRRQDLSYDTYIEESLAQVRRSDVMLLLDGWHASEGVREELVAAMAHKVNVIPFTDYTGKVSPQNPSDIMAYLPKDGQSELDKAVEAAMFGPCQNPDFWVCDCAAEGESCEECAGREDLPEQYCGVEDPPATIDCWECGQYIKNDEWHIDAHANAHKNIEEAIVRKRITDEAWELVVEGERQSNYGHPEQDFRTTGRQWGALIENWLVSENIWCGREGAELGTRVPDLPPKLVALMMASLKASRESQRPKRDNRVDGLGYWLCADRIEEGY